MTSPRTSRPYAVLPLLFSALLIAAFVIVPPLAMPVNRSGGALPTRAQEMVTVWMTGGGAELPPALQHFVDGWRDYHLAKATLAAAALVSLGRVARGAGRRWAVGGRAYGQAVTVVVAGGLAFFAALVVMANLQGALAPLASAVSLLPPANGDASYAATLAQVSTQVSVGHPTGAAAVVLTDFAFFHLVLAVLMWLLAIGLGTIAFRLARRRLRTGRAEVATAREKRLLTMLSAMAVATALVALVVAAANLSTAGDPGPGLTAYLDGLRG